MTIEHGVVRAPRVANALAQEYFELHWDIALLLGGDGAGGPPDTVSAQGPHRSRGCPARGRHHPAAADP